MLRNELEEFIRSTGVPPVSFLQDHRRDACATKNYPAAMRTQHDLRKIIKDIILISHRLLSITSLVLFLALLCLQSALGHGDAAGRVLFEENFSSDLDHGWSWLPVLRERVQVRRAEPDLGRIEEVCKLQVRLGSPNLLAAKDPDPPLPEYREREQCGRRRNPRPYPSYIAFPGALDILRSSSYSTA